MNALRRLTLAVVLAHAAMVRADYLPDPAAAEAALWASAEVAQARAELAAQTLRSEGLRRGQGEWSVTADVAQRRVQAVPRESLGEWALGVMHPVRLPARAASDRAVADALTAHAQASLGEALHESGRDLLSTWFEWLTEAAQTDVWQSQSALAERQLAAADARIRLGEAPRSDRVNADAALAQIRMQQSQAHQRLQAARSRLAARFPGLPEPVAGALPTPVLPAGTAAAYVDSVLEHNHELARARQYAAVLRAEVQQRASRRSADPSVGLFYRNESGGNERVLGVNVGLTLPGPARGLDQEAAVAVSTSADAAVERLAQRLREEARASFESAVLRVESWQQADRAARALESAATMAARAYSLGEGSLDQVLVTRRLALDGALQARQAQADALAANARLQLDAHALWPLDADESSGHAHP